jgi:hypothetical protein
MRRFILALACATTLGVAVPALAANPPGAGQPNQSCEEQPASPPGFNSGGFANADTHYAGNGAPSLNANSNHAVSQYDVACFQVSQH